MRMRRATRPFILDGVERREGDRSDPVWDLAFLNKQGPYLIQTDIQ